MKVPSDPYMGSFPILRGKQISNFFGDENWGRDDYRMENEDNIRSEEE